jgi:hypothetical protein
MIPPKRAFATFSGWPFFLGGPLPGCIDVPQESRLRDQDVPGKPQVRNTALFDAVTDRSLSAACYLRGFENSERGAVFIGF